MTMATTEIVSTEAPQITPLSLLSAAIDKGVELSQLEKLMDLQDRYESKEAKKAFTEAMARFQSELEPIAKRRDAHNSKYADIDDIAQAIRPILKQTGLSYQFKQSQEKDLITVTCVVSHSLGHSEETSLTAANDVSGGKNNIQAIASAVTYLRRYTLTGALGITTGSDDNDGGKPAIQVDELLNYMATVRDEFPSITAVKESLALNEYSEAKEAWLELDEETQRNLWRAPTKGGIFTTEERAKMKSNEWSNV